MTLVRDLRTGETASLLSIHDGNFALLLDQRQISFYRSLQELEFLTPDPSLSQGGSPEVGPSVPLQVASHGTRDAAARPLGALAVYWIGSVAPNNAIEGDLWLEPASQALAPGRLSLFSDGAFVLVSGGGGLSIGTAAGLSIALG
jgi:hypothetical protein